MASDEKGHVSQQALRVLATIRLQPAGVTAYQLVPVAAKYTNRIQELRDAGYNIVLARDEDGRRVYKESDEPIAPRVTLRRGQPAYFFLLGPANVVYVSPAYPTPEERSSEAVAYVEKVGGDPAQLMWLDDLGHRKRDRRFQAGPLELTTLDTGSGIAGSSLIRWNS